MIRKKLKIASENKPFQLKEENENELEDKKTITSPFFETEESFWQKLYSIECRLSEDLNKFNFLTNSVAAVYNPVEYAADLHCAYLKKFLDGPKSVLLIGMNPGPWGMIQTGVPFGYIPAVRDWLKLTGEVLKPRNELAVRPVTGLNCDKLEQSGQRFWSLLREISNDSPEKFFKNCFVHNLCPLAFFHASGRNITPAELKSDLKKNLQFTCNKHLKEAIDLISPKLIISIGRYAEDRVQELIKHKQIDLNIEHKCMPHPSPRSLNNTNWNEKAKRWLIDNDVMKFIDT